MNQPDSPVISFKAQCPIDDGRKDVIVIFLKSDDVAAATALAAGWSAELGLNPETQAGMLPLSPGVAFAHHTDGTSHGAARCACIADAVAWLDEHVGESDMPLEERERLLLDTFLRAALDHHGIDPVQPYRYVGA